MRRIVLDTETTGLDSAGGHRIIEIGGVELNDRSFTGQSFHRYLNPQREIDQAATEVHGMTWKDLKDKPVFADLAKELLAFLEGAELVIHNAPFDVAFLESEFAIVGDELALSGMCKITDTLAMARKMYPGQRNSLDALCKRLGVNNGHRTLHGALLDSEILADVYLTMTGGQTALLLDSDRASAENDSQAGTALQTENLLVVKANESELAAHGAWMAKLGRQGAEL